LCSDSGELDQYTCKCVTGWAGENCETDVDECDSSPCPVEMDCVDGMDSWTCDVRPQPVR
jgi:Notch-like protein